MHVTARVLVAEYKRDPRREMKFKDRVHAAEQIVARLRHLRGHDPPVLAIPRGAVPMGRVLAESLGGELDIVLVRKLRAPGNPELAIGAVDEEGHVALNEAAQALGVEILRGFRGSRTRHEVAIPAGENEIRGDLVVPPHAKAIVVFAHGSGSGRRSPRNRFVAETLERHGIATLLVDLLTEAEEAEGREHVFDIELLTRRLLAATRWLRGRAETARLPMGYFGASTGAACALLAAARLGDAIGAVVSRGGRPDLALDALPRVRAPTLLLVGGEDQAVIGLNQLAYARIATHVKRLEVVPGATHLFEEPGALDRVAESAARWFEAHLVRRGSGVAQAPLPERAPSAN